MNDATWKGGFIRRNAKGEKVFVLQQRLGGKRWKKTLGPIGEDAALQEWAAFMRDPRAYFAEPVPEVVPEDDEEAIYLSAALVETYLATLVNSAKWTNEKRANLTWWMARLADSQGRLLDLRRVKLAKHVLPVLRDEDGAEVPGARHKREALKALYGWLAKTGQIEGHQDPVRVLPVGKGRVAQTNGKDKVVPKEHVQAVVKHLTACGDARERYGYALIVQAATGWHVTEVVRFIGSGEIIEPVPEWLREPGVTAVLKGPRHKNGRVHFAKVGESATFAAHVLLGATPHDRGLGAISLERYVAAVKAACEEVNVPRFSPAWMRHTNATHALQQRGVTPEQTGRFLGHGDGLMADTVYGVNAVPPKAPTIMDEPLPASKERPRRRRKTA